MLGGRDMPRMVSNSYSGSGFLSQSFLLQGKERLRGFLKPGRKGELQEGTARSSYASEVHLQLSMYKRVALNPPGRHRGRYERKKSLMHMRRVKPGPGELIERVLVNITFWRHQQTWEHERPY